MTHEQALETQADERYLLGEMSELERYRFEEHFFQCDECAESMRLGHQLQAQAPALFPTAPARQPAKPATARPEGSRARRLAPWAAAAVLALALVYQDRVADAPGGPVAPQPLAVEPVALRPATRGALQNVPLPPSGESLALALDVNVGAPGDGLTYTLAREDGTTIVAGQARVPPQGTPLVLLVPAAQLDQGYHLIVLRPADAGVPPAEYRFNAVYTETGGRF